MLLRQSYAFVTIRWVRLRGRDERRAERRRGVKGGKKNTGEERGDVEIEER